MTCEDLVRVSTNLSTASYGVQLSTFKMPCPDASSTRLITVQFGNELFFSGCFASFRRPVNTAGINTASLFLFIPSAPAIGNTTMATNMMPARGENWKKPHNARNHAFAAFEDFEKTLLLTDNAEMGGFPLSTSSILGVKSTFRDTGMRSTINIPQVGHLSEPVSN